MKDRSGRREISIWSFPDVHGGEPVTRAPQVPQRIDVLDRIDAGDSVEEVAKDFTFDEANLELLVALRDSLKPDTLPNEQTIVVSREAMLGFLGHGHPHSAAWFLELQRTFAEATGVEPAQPAAQEAA